MSSLSCATTENGCLVRVVGRGTLKDSPAFRAFVQRCLATRGYHVTVDLSDCDYLDSTFLGCLIGLHKMGGEGDSRLKFYAQDGRCTRLFSWSMLDRYLQVSDRCPPTTDEFQEIPSCELDARELGVHIMQCHQRLAAAGGPEAEVFESIVAKLSKELDN